MNGDGEFGKLEDVTEPRVDLAKTSRDGAANAVPTIRLVVAV